MWIRTRPRALHEHAPLVDLCLHGCQVRVTEGDSDCRRLRSLLLCLCDVFRALNTSFICTPGTKNWIGPGKGFILPNVLFMLLSEGNCFLLFLSPPPPSFSVQTYFDGYRLPTNCIAHHELDLADQKCALLCGACTGWLGVKHQVILTLWCS